MSLTAPVRFGQQDSRSLLPNTSGGGIDTGLRRDWIKPRRRILLRHEWHHAACEIACTRAELTAHRSLYVPYFGCAEAAELEEAMATAQAVRWMEEPVRSRAERWTSRQGPGYRDYKSWISERAFSEGLDRAARLMLSAMPDRGPRADSSLHTFLFRGARWYRSMPVSRIDDLGATGIGILRPFPREQVAWGADRSANPSSLRSVAMRRS